MIQREVSYEFKLFAPVNLDSSVNPLLEKLPGIEGNTLVLAVKNSREEISLRIFQRVVLYSGISNPLLDSIGEILISHIY